MKLVINAAGGGFRLSDEALQFMQARGCADGQKVARDNPALVEAVETLGSNASGSVATLRVVEIPDGVDWVIEECEGCEWVAERHRTWRVLL